MKIRWQRKQPDYHEMPDSELVALAKEDQDVFGVIYERYVEKIYNYIFYRTGNHHDAEDLTAMVFYRALGHIHNYTDRGIPFQAWLYRIAHNLVANWHRDRGRRKIIALEDYVGPDFQDDTPHAHTESLEERELLLESIRQLPPERQQLLILKYIERLPNAEIGEIMGRTEGAIKSLYHRTLNNLRDELTPRMLDNASQITDKEG